MLLTVPVFPRIPQLQAESYSLFLKLRRTEPENNTNLRTPNKGQAMNVFRKSLLSIEKSADLMLSAVL